MCLNFAAPHPRACCYRAGSGRALRSSDRGVIYSCRVPHPWAPGEYVWRQLANDLSARIADGTYPLGSALPAEDELASEYAVARSTVRRALGEMHKRKLIKTLHGQRNAVVAMPGPGGLPG
jgi:regulatory GntR family protein